MRRSAPKKGGANKLANRIINMRGRVGHMIAPEHPTNRAERRAAAAKAKHDPAAILTANAKGRIMELANGAAPRSEAEQRILTLTGGDPANLMALLPATEANVAKVLAEREARIAAKRDEKK